MAGDWIKVEEHMPEKPEVSAIAAMIGIEDPDAVAGKLIRVWSWATRNCNADGVTNVTAMYQIDRCAGVTGFAKAMEKAGWLAVDGDEMSFPNFARHCSQTAKERALTQKRVAKKRSLDCNGASVTKTLPEKRREEKSKKPPLSPKGESEKNSGSIPTNPQAIRIAQLYRRRPTTPWSAKEIRAFRALGAIDPEDLEMVCRYTDAERAKGDQGCHRRDLLTFLNNYPGELDRARQKQPAAKPQITFID